VRVVGAVGEEGDSRGARFLTRQRQAPEMVVIGEPSGWEQVCLGYKGTLWFTCTMTRPVTHSAGAGESACEAAFRFWNDVQVWAANENTASARRFDQVSPTLRGMYSDSDGLTDAARLTINIRLPQRMEPSIALKKLQTLAQGGVIWPLDHLPAYRSEKNTPPARALLAAIRKQGGQPTFSVKSGSSDMNIAGPVWGCPMVAYGPGDSTLDHTPGEHIIVPEYLRSIAVLAEALPMMMA
jgi:LysW-gamma-L-lysine carboxypeptidase